MFFKLFSALGLADQGHKRAARAARAAFVAAYPGVPIAWIDTEPDEPTSFKVGVHHGQKQPKECRFYAVDKETFIAAEIKVGSET